MKRQFFYLLGMLATLNAYAKVDCKVKTVKNNSKTISINRNLVFDSLMYNTFYNDYHTPGEGHDFIVNTITDPANEALNISPSPVEFLRKNDNSINNAALVNQEAARVYKLALQWSLVKGDTAQAKAYLNKVKEYLLAWADINVATDFMPGEVAYAPFLYAYSIVKPALQPKDIATIDAWLKNRFYSKYKYFSPRANNWETCRVNLILDIGYVTDDDEIINYGKNAYKTLLNVNILEGGVSEDLQKRDAHVYHAFNLFFYAKLLRSIWLVEGEQQGKYWRDLKNNINEDVRGMVLHMKPCIDDPENNVHLEFAHTAYAPDRLRSDCNKPFNPADVTYALNQLVFNFPKEALSSIQVYSPTITPYNRGLEFYLATLQLNRPLN